MASVIATGVRVAAARATVVGAILAAVLLDAAGLVLLRRSPAIAWHDLAQVGGSHGTGTDTVAGNLAAAGLFAVAAWIALAATTCLLSAAPGVIGRIAEHAARVLVPATIRRTVAGAAGLGVLLAPVAASATTPTSPPPSRPAATSSIPAPVWPTGSSVASPASSRPARSIDPAPRRTTPTSDPHTNPAPRTTVPASRSGRDTTPPARLPDRSDEITVRPGDSLWMITARRLGGAATDRRIAQDWPALYRANRGVIGDDPSLIRPGQRLRPPGRHTDEEPQ